MSKRTDEEILTDIGTYNERYNLHIRAEWQVHRGKALRTCGECRELRPIIDRLDREFFSA